MTVFHIQVSQNSNHRFSYTREAKGEFTIKEKVMWLLALKMVKEVMSDKYKEYVIRSWKGKETDYPPEFP